MQFALLLAFCHVVGAYDTTMWSQEVVVRHGIQPVVRYQARIENDYLMIKATHNKGWHTYAMDNELRAAAALKGKMSLGIQEGIDIQVESGLELVDPWLQTDPKDLSEPEIRWFSYGFDDTAWFACRVKEANLDQAIVRIRGQACSGETCCQVNIDLKLQPVKYPGNEPPEFHLEPIQTLLKGLVPVKPQPNRTPGF